MVKHGIKKNKKAHFLSRFIKATSDFFSSKKEFVEGKLEEQEEDIWIFLVSFHPSSNIEIIKYFNYESRFNGAFWRNNLPRIKDETYVINLRNKISKGTHWVLLCIDINTAVHFDLLVIEYIPQEVLCKIKDKSITHNMILLCVYFIVLLS